MKTRLICVLLLVVLCCALPLAAMASWHQKVSFALAVDPLPEEIIGAEGKHAGFL